MSRIIAALCALFALTAHANEDIARRVQGDWLVTTPDNLRTWVLQVRKHKEDGPGRIEFYGYYGPNGETFPTPVDVVITKGGPELKLSVLAGRTRIAAVLDRENLLTGHTVTSRASHPIRMERLSVSEIAKRRLNVPVFPKDSRIEVIYLSTPDCTYCSIWNRGSRSDLLAFAEGKSVRFIEVKGDTLRLPIDARHYPADYHWVHKQIGASRGVPRFMLAIDGKVMLNVVGTVGYENVFFPALKEVAARREAGF